MIHLDDFDDSVERDRQSRADERATLVWLLVMSLFFGALIWLAWTGV